MASLCPVLKRVDAGAWTRHFEDQAKEGASERAFLNRHYIILHDLRGGAVSPVVSSEVSSVAQPPIVAPVEQAAAQAAEEVKREKTDVEQETIQKDLSRSIKAGQHSRLPVSISRGGSAGSSGIPCKRRRKQILVPRDIFS